MRAIQILISDDHAIVREGLRALIASEPGMELIGEAANGAEAVLKAHTLHPDVILMDLVMPRMDGLEAINEIKRENPSARILVLTSLADDNKLAQALQAGAAGYLLKGTPPHKVLQAIQAVYEGDFSN